MKKFFLYALALVVVLPLMAFLTACDDDDANTWMEYRENREANQLWITEQEALTNPDGSKFYDRLVPAWNKDSYILIHWFNDRAETAGNLQPMLTSSVSVWYTGRNMHGKIFDADSTSTDGTKFAVNSVVQGWQVALQYMHVGDSVQILLPYDMAYDASSPSTDILPYSALQFNIRLLDVPTYEIP